LLFHLIKMMLFFWSIQIWSEMQTDFLPNFILCNTTQRFVRSIKGTHHSSHRSNASTGKPYFYCGSHVSIKYCYGLMIRDISTLIWKLISSTYGDSQDIIICILD
jgi:hypothetical protein